MQFTPNIIPVDIIKKSASGGTYFRDTYYSITNKFYKNSWKEVHVLTKNIFVLTFIMLN